MRRVPAGWLISVLESRPSPTANAVALAVPFREALRYWARLGFISFGGPAGQIAIMHRELVDRRRWISEERFLHAPQLLHAAAGSGSAAARDLHRLAHAPHGGRDRRRRVLRHPVGLHPARAVLHLRRLRRGAGGRRRARRLQAGRGRDRRRGGDEDRRAGAQAARRTSPSPPRRSWRSTSCTCRFRSSCSLAGAVGLLGAQLAPADFGGAGGRASRRPGATGARTTRSTITRRRRPTPCRRRRASCAPWPSAWRSGLLPFLVLVAWRGWSSLHAHEYRFFTLAAFVTFGGAYSVLAYVTQVATTSLGG